MHHPAVAERRRVRLFPLPGVVLLPETLLPLHVFEPRYRELLADALADDRLIGMQTIDPDAPVLQDGRPALLPVGCAGEVVEHEALEDGRSNIVLKGTFRYRIESEPPSGRAYRVAEVTPLPVAALPRSGVPELAPRQARATLLERVRHLADSAGRSEARELPSGLSDEGFVNEAASRIGLDAAESYRFLAMDSLAERYSFMLARIENVQRRLDFLEPFRRPGGEPRWN